MTFPEVPEIPASRVGRIRFVGAVVLALLAALIGLVPRWNAALQTPWFDALQAVWPRTIVSMPAVVVEIDARSLASVGRWPWPRARLADLVSAVNRHRPAAIGVDIVMPEPDPLSPERLLAGRGVASPVVAQALAALPSNDALLAGALAAAPAVLAVAGMPETTGMPLRAAPVTVRDVDAAANAGTPVALAVERFAGALTSIAELDRAASGWGLISVDPVGGVIRRIPLVGAIDGTLIGSLALEMFRVAANAPGLRLFASGSSVLGIAVDKAFVDTEADGAVRVYFSPRDGRRFVSAIDVLDGRVDPERLAHKLVLVGVTGLGLGEYHYTPVGERMPGSEIHAQLLENLYDRSWLTRPTWAAAVEAVAFALLGALLVGSTPVWNQRNTMLLALGCIALLLLAAVVAFRSQRLLFDALSPAIFLAFVYGCMLVLTLAETTRQRRALERVVQRQRERNARIAGELDAARRIQTAMLPRPDTLGADRRVDLAATMIPAREVGGDLYDFFRLDTRRLFFLIGDVAGKGLPASIFMAVSKALYKSTTLRAPVPDMGALMSAANVEVSRDNPEMLFVTVFAGILDLATGELAYCNAGHENPWRIGAADSAASRIVDGGGPPLCAADDYAYAEARVRLQPGEWLCLVSDGVTEALNRSEELYGSARLEGVLSRLHGRPSSARDVVDAVRADVTAFAAGTEQADDVTVLVLHWNGPQQERAVEAEGG